MGSAMQRKHERPKGGDRALTTKQAAVPESYTLPVFQLHGERARLVVTGRRTDNDGRCELVVITDTGGSVALYPHGAAQLGIRVDEATAVKVARAILAAVDAR